MVKRTKNIKRKESWYRGKAGATERHYSPLQKRTEKFSVPDSIE